MLLKWASPKEGSVAYLLSIYVNLLLVSTYCCAHPALEGLKSVGSVRMTQPLFRLDLSVRMRNVKPWCQKAMCLACPRWQVRKWHLVPEQHRGMAALQSWTGLTSTGQQQTRFHAVTHRHCSCYTDFATLTNRSH